MLNISEYTISGLKPHMSVFVPNTSCDIFKNQTQRHHRKAPCCEVAFLVAVLRLHLLDWLASC